MTLEYFFIHVKGNYVRIDIVDISYIQSVAHHVKIHTDREVFRPHLSLRQLESELPKHLFARVNRGVLVFLPKVVSFDKENVYLKDTGFSFGSKFRDKFMSKVVVLLHKESKQA